MGQNMKDDNEDDFLGPIPPKRVNEFRRSMVEFVFVLLAGGLGYKFVEFIVWAYCAIFR